MRRSQPRRSRSWLLALLVAGWAGPAAAATIRFTVEDLPDAPEAPDRWRYVYTLDAFPYDAGSGFTVFFDPLLVGSIETPLPLVGADWDAIAYQPDPLGFDGFYDAEALVGAPSTAASFAVVFVWIGVGTPGAQPYELRDASYVPFATGTTVPEPRGAGAALAGLALVVAGRRRTGRGHAC